MPGAFNAAATAVEARIGLHQISRASELTVGFFFNAFFLICSIIMSKQIADNDRNFDDLASRFKHKVYGGLKGTIRLAVLHRDFAQHLPFVLSDLSDPLFRKLRILDAGGGQGQFSLHLAQAGHELVICDISSEMLKLAEAEITAVGVADKVQLLHCAIQDLPQRLPDCQFDLILCHAVIEWMAQPQSLLPCLTSYLKLDGYLSLTYYNLHSLIYKNLLRANFKKIMAKDYGGARGSLTPINPIDPEDFKQWLSNLPYKLLTTSGIRVFHDYILDQQLRERSPEDLIALELQLSQMEPYRSLGRYIHVLAKKLKA